MFKIKNSFYLNSQDLYPLKKRKKILYKTTQKINVFLKKKKYICYSGNRYTIARVKTHCMSHKIKQLIFTKKPFSGPIKKFKA
jgi:hypothetical protein